MVSPTLQTLLFLTLAATHSAQTSPEPQPDPLFPTHTRLFVQSAGRFSTTTPKQRLSTIAPNHICPARYPHGLTIRCTVRPRPEMVLFRVDGTFERIEKHKPYFIAGDFKGVVFPWAIPGKRSVIIECLPSEGDSVKVQVVFQC